MASQRHKLWEQGATAAGEIHAQGVVAPGIAMQVDPEALNVLKPGPPLFNTGLELRSPGDGGVEVPIGDPGGPLSGSTLTGAIPEELGPTPPPDGGGSVDPEPGEEPTLDSIAPAEAVIGSTDFTLRIIGTNFTDTSVITFNGGDEATEFVSDTELTTGIKPSTASTPGEYPVTVKQGSFETEPQMFEFTEAAPEGETRTFPLGPFSLVRVDPSVDPEPAGVWIVVSRVDGQDLVEGDAVLVEATGNTSINGAYTVEQLQESPTERRFFAADKTLASPIEGAGRLTINAGA